jgi:hypothetical protein
MLFPSDVHRGLAADQGLLWTDVEDVVDFWTFRRLTRFPRDMDQPQIFGKRGFDAR